ncbi:MAG: mannonate dehydratase [Planctomycetaceae bacterium]|nr:mannonate dehydratase [Planctomycetaceae bacterium]|tara:strand:- start:1206 stop:2171 length:966 start_codon:yes stop_codon:yes gene_type:complete
MKLASVLTPLSEENLALAAQTGVECVTIRYQGPTLEDWKPAVERIRSYGMEIAAVEDAIAMENIIRGTQGRDEEIDGIISLLRIMKQLDIPVLCYNFMAGTDWVRTKTDVIDRAGAKVTQFNLSEIDLAVSLDDSSKQLEHEDLDAESLWENLKYFLERVLPVAEELEIDLAMHPDDPPLEFFMGRARIMNCVEGFKRLVELVPSQRNGICFCQGSFVEMGASIPAAIYELGPHIRYVHFRDIRGTKENFTETFHDNGPTDMAAAVKAYYDIGFEGPIRPDHVPQLYGEDAGEPGYTQLGRLFAYGYMRGLMHATQAEHES